MKRSVLLVPMLLAVVFAGCNSTPASDATGDCAVPASSSGNPVANICTNMGVITIELFADKVPVTACNFYNLARTGYYDGVTFHRIITDFMMQGGDPDGTGRGGAAYGGGSIDDEFDSSLRHDKPGMLSMANSGPDTGASQFFITFAATPWLDGKHAIFGQVTGGMDVVDEIEAAAGSGSGTPRTPVSMTKVVVDAGHCLE